jgi:hypothetical protein
MWLPQNGSAGVNFIAQTLSVTEKYFCCPPTRLVMPCYCMTVNMPGIEALLLLPEWHGANYWPYFFNGGQQKLHVVSVTTFPALFFFTNQATSKVFTAASKLKMLALRVQTWRLGKRFSRMFVIKKYVILLVCD